MKNRVFGAGDAAFNLARQFFDRFIGATHAWQISERSRSVARADICRRICDRRNSTASLSRTALGNAEI